MFPISDTDIRRRRRPIVNILIIALCAFAFFYELWIGESGRLVLFYRYGVIPVELAHGLDYDVLVTPGGTFDIATPFSNWVSLFSAMFLHANWLHFAVNMLFLWVFGDNVEDRFGHFRYLLFYLAAGVAAAWLQIAFVSQSQNPTIGASGAIAGVLGAYLLLYPYSRIRTAFILFFFPFFIRVPAVLLLGFWFLMQFVSGIGSLLPMEDGGVAYWAHIGGFLFGITVVVLYKAFTRQRIWPKPPSAEYPPTQYWRGRPL